MLDFENVCFSYDKKTVLENFTFSIEEGKTTAILGPSGFGKTTVLELASGLLKPQSGKISLPCSKKASFVFQEDRLLPWATAIENMTAVNIKKDAAMEYLEKVGLASDAEKYPDELSGGMQRRLAIARSLAFGGEIFFLDEPLRGLDIKTSAEIIELIRTELSGKTVLMVTHSPAEAFFLSDRIIVAGKNPLEILADRKKSDFSCEAELSDFLKKII
ncbi:MAG: ABC transporter ATP-binding protein [Oscillospiraceae bacterium]|nr:ABC transporter ATP-binding protein [Oscillospiraceae bacterium]